VESWTRVRAGMHWGRIDGKERVAVLYPEDNFAD
jgi:hypothetical protein